MTEAFAAGAALVDRPSVLIVDDQAANLRLLSTMLEGRYRVRAANSGQMAIRAARQEVPDLVLLDIGLPDMDGYEVCRTLRAMPECADVPVIFISGRTGPADKVESFESGGFDYVEKPFSVGEVLARVANHVDLHRRRIHDREQAAALEQLLRERDSLLEERRRLTAMIVHDVGSPLMVIAHFLERLDVSKELSSEWHDRLHDARLSTSNIREMTQQALAISRLESPKVPLHLEAHQLEDAIGGGLAAARAKVDTIEIPTGVEVWCDRSIIERVIANLVNNAEDHGAPPVRLRVSADSTSAAISIEDSGEGVDPDRELAVFEDYVSTGGFGRGLGLSFCRQAVLAHDGQIGVTGSDFWFRLPRA